MGERRWVFYGKDDQQTKMMSRRWNAGEVLKRIAYPAGWQVDCPQTSHAKVLEDVDWLRHLPLLLLMFMNHVGLIRKAVISGWIALGIGVDSGQASNLSGWDETVMDRPAGEATEISPYVSSLMVDEVDGFLGRVRLGLRPPEGARAVGITLVVPGSADGFFRVFLKRGTEDVLLATDLLEHTGLAEQLFLVVPVEELGVDATLEFQSTVKEGPVERLSVVWLGSQEMLMVEADRKPRVWLGHERIRAEDETGEGAVLRRSDRVGPRTVRAVLQTAPVRVDEGAEFVFDLPVGVEAVAFRAEVAGVEVGEELGFWINGEGPYPLTLTVPEMDDPGLSEKNGVWTYVGWRRAAFFIPGRWLSPGENVLEVGRTGSGEGLEPGVLALKDVRIDVKQKVLFRTAVPLPEETLELPDDPELPLP